MSLALFIDQNGNPITDDDFTDALIKVGANECKFLFIHSDISFGRIAPEMKKKELLPALHEAIKKALPNTKLIVPTFSYSFCNDEKYDVLETKTSMGVLNEYLRKMPGTYRTLDPILSVNVPEEIKYRFNDLGESSLGKGSALDIIHELDAVKFLFFGIRMGCCFTYLHYIEKMLEVPYRYDQKFVGYINGYDRNLVRRKQSIHTACLGVKPADFYYFEDELEDRGILKKVHIGDQSIACISEEDAYEEIKMKIENDINYFLEEPFKESDLVHEYTKKLERGRITHC